MKRGVVALAVAFLALAGTGCIVTSVYPFYSDATVVFEPALLGRWLDSDAKTTWTFVKEGEKAYRMTSVEPNPGPEGDKGATETRNFIVHLLQLGGSRFLDAFPSDAPDLTVGTHFLAKMELRDGALRVRGMDTHAVDRVATNGPCTCTPAQAAR